MPTLNAEVTTLFLEFSRAKLLGQYWPRLRTTVEPLTDAQFWWRPNAASNSIGNLILHLNGNVHQWLIDSFNHLPDNRDRPAEFEANVSLSATVLLERLSTTMQQAEEVLTRITETDLIAPFSIQGYNVKGLDAVYQVVEHFGLHYGQILFIAKYLTDADLGFYSELKVTGRAS